MSESRILKWIIPVDDQEHAIRGEFLHAEPMTEFEREQGANIRARGEGPSEWVTIWTRVDDGPDLPPGKAEWSEQDLTYDRPEWHVTYNYRVFGTGQPIEDNRWYHMATVRQEPFVWHVLRHAELPARIVREVTG